MAQVEPYYETIDRNQSGSAAPAQRPAAAPESPKQTGRESISISKAKRQERHRKVLATAAALASVTLAAGFIYLNGYIALAREAGRSASSQRLLLQEARQADYYANQKAMHVTPQMINTKAAAAGMVMPTHPVVSR